MRWRDLVWLLLILGGVSLGVRQLGVSHELDGQTYEAELFGYASTSLRFENGSFTMKKHTCTSSGDWHGTYRLEGNVLYLNPSLQPSMRYEVRKSAGRTYLDSSGEDYDKSLKLTADASGGPRPPRWQGSQLRVNGFYPGQPFVVAPEFRLAATVDGRAIYWSDSVAVAVSLKGNRVAAVGGPRLIEADGQTLLEYGEKNAWIVQCLGQNSRHDEARALDRFPGGLAVGVGPNFTSAYFLGEISEIVTLRDAIVFANLGSTGPHQETVQIQGGEDATRGRQTSPHEGAAWAANEPAPRPPKNSSPR